MELNVIYHEDCFNTMFRMENKSVDLILTSPPYLDDEVEGNYYEFLERFISSAKRISHSILMFNSSRRLIDICNRYADIKHVLIWDKVFSLPAFKYEPIFVWSDDKIFGRGRIYRDCLRYQIPRKKRHINENPLGLYRELLKFFPKAKIVYDPFMGSGTTAEACILEDRYYIGSEINNENIHIIITRIANALKQTENT